MKKHFYFLFCVLALILSACSEELNGFQNSDQEITTIHVSTTDFAAETRTTITPGYNVTWNEKDVIGIFPMEDKSKQIAFDLSGGERSQNATFDGKGWALKSDVEYTAYYPCSTNSFQDKTSIVLDYTGQVQTDNGSTSHLGDYDYLKTGRTSPANGALDFQFEHIGSILTISLEVPISTYKKVEFHTDGYFYTRGFLNLETGEVLPDEESKTHTITLDMKNVELNRGLIQASTFLFPVNLEGHNISAYAFDTEGEIRGTLTFKGSNFLPGTYWYRSINSMERFVPYVTFKAESQQTFRLTKQVDNLEYLVGDGGWTPLGTQTITFGGNYGDLKLRGQSSYGTAASRMYYDHCTVIFGNTTPVACSGDIRTLVDYLNYGKANTENARFCSLFDGCKVLTSAPDLPITTLADGCYWGMFGGCTSLTEAPELPAQKTSDVCYGGMFSNCKNLTKAPKLPATELGISCYFMMFNGCTGLTQAPELPATYLAEGCYAHMFNGCTSLTQAPELPAIKMEANSYEMMFSGCTSLTTAPELPAAALAQECYWGMFSGCTSLTTAPQLPAMKLKDECYMRMFGNCTSLTTAPELPAETLVSNCYKAMFQDCAQLSWIKMMGKDISAEGCLSDWISGVSESGTFVRHENAKWNVRDVIPLRWTVKTAPGEYQPIEEI